MSDVQYLDVSHQFVKGVAGELKLMMTAPEGKPDNAKIVYDGNSQAMLIRNSGQIIRLPLFIAEFRFMLLDGRKMIHVTEMNGEDEGYVYEAPLEMVNALIGAPAKFTTDNGNVFEGCFDSENNGMGKITYTNGSIHEGDFAGGILDGKGKITTENGDVIEGDFIEGKLNGKGKFSIGGEIYEGDFADGVMNGKGKYTYPDGKVYYGDFVNGEKQGKGKYTWEDGDVWEGNFVHDQLHGKGIITHADGTVLECNFVDGEIRGRGKITFPDNSEVQSADWAVNEE